MASFIAPFTGPISRNSGVSQFRRQSRPVPRISRKRISFSANGAVNTQEIGLPKGRLCSKFSEKVSGEWFGHEVSFCSITGAPLNIEERFVPDAYREWGVEIKGFDTVTSTQATTTVYQKRTRVLPSVGCEADAVVPDSVTCNYENVFGFTDGSFCAGPSRLSQPHEWSFTLVDPHDQHIRARIEFETIDYSDGKNERIGCRNSKVTVFLERKEADFCDGQILPGCGGSESFASEGSLDLDQLNGIWNISSEVFSAKNSWQLFEKSRTSSRYVPEELVSVALPRGLSMAMYRNDSMLNVEVGWLHENLRMVMKRVYDEDGALQSISRELETRQE